eukprot:3548147-Prorocentrum_lima.AAC.1
MRLPRPIPVVLRGCAAGPCRRGGSCSGFLPTTAGDLVEVAPEVLQRDVAEEAAQQGRRPAHGRRIQ